MRYRPLVFFAFLLGLPGVGVAADLVVDGTSMTITTDTVVAGNVFVQNGGILTIQGATLTLALQFDEQYHVDVSDSSRLDLQDGRINSTGGQYWVEMYGNGTSSPTLNVSGAASLITNHSGIRPADGTRITVTGGDVEEVQLHDRVTVSISNAAAYPVLFFDNQNATLSTLNTGPSISNSVSVPGGWSLTLNNANIGGYQIDLLGSSTVACNDCDGIVLSIHTPGNLGPSQQVVDGVTSPGLTSGSLTNLGPRFYWSNSNIALLNLYAYGADNVLLRNLQANEVNAYDSALLTVGQPGIPTVLDCNLCEAYDTATLDVEAATIDATSNTPSATCSFHAMAPTGRGVMSFHDMDLRQLFITAIESGTINLYNCQYDPAKITIVDPTATVNYYSSSANFSGSPRIGKVPLTVQFTDASSGTILSWDWDFGDGSTSSSQNPSHTYAAAGRYGVALTVTRTIGTETTNKPDYVLATTVKPVDIITGPGPGTSSPPRVLAFDALAVPHAATDITAYGVLAYGANVGGGAIESTGSGDILTGPGPGTVFGPQVRAFRADSTTLAKVNLYAYGTLRYGVAATGIALDADAPAEIATSPGPGAVFGPHVRAFNYDGVAITAIAKVSFFAYGTLKYGVNASRGQLEDDSIDEILTVPGPGVVFAPQVRAFRYAGTVSALTKVNFFAFATSQYGGRAAGGDLDSDGWDEILAGQGPGPRLSTQVRGFDYDNGAVSATAGVDFEAIPGGIYGAKPGGGDVDGDGAGEILVGRGPDPAGSARLRGFDFTSAVIPIAALDFAPYTFLYGLNHATEDLGF